MNIPKKLSTFITDETYFYHQQLAKKFYKAAKGCKKSKKQNSNDIDDKTLSDYDQFSTCELKRNFKEELMKWLFSMSLPDRIKTVSIENKWFAAMVRHMYSKYKYDQKIRFQLIFDDISTDEYCYQQYLNSPQVSFPNELNLENFFYFNNDRYISEDRNVNENLFLKELRYFTLREQNDTLTLSTSLLENELLFKYYIDTFSNEKAFQHHCSVSFDKVLKVYNWDFPEWFNPKEYNSISEFLIAYIEQVLSIRFWYALEERREKLLKNIPIISFSLCEQNNFNELFDNREKLINFLQAEYGLYKEKLFTLIINLEKLLTEIRNDDNLMSKIKKPKPDNIKNYFYLLNKTKFELFEPQLENNNHEIIEKFKKLYLENSEEVFIDELVFCRIDNIFSIEEFLASKIFLTLHNIYTDKNACDLMNEVTNIKKSISEQHFSKSKKGKVKKGVKKKRSDSTNKIKSEDKKQMEKTDDITKPEHNKITLTEELNDKSTSLSIKGTDKKQEHITNENKMEEVKHFDSIEISKVSKMSWRKSANLNNENLPNQTHRINQSSNLTNSNKVSSQQKESNGKNQPHHNSNEKYVSDLVNSLINKIISEDLTISAENEEKPITTKEVKDEINTKSLNNSKNNKNGKKLKNEKIFNKNLQIKTNNLTNQQKSTNNTKPNNNKILNIGNKSDKNNSNFRKEKDFELNNKNTIHLKSNEFQQNEVSQIKTSREFTNNLEITSDNSQLNLTFSKSIGLPSLECKIESINHEILSGCNNSDKVNNSIDLKKVMVDNYSQTDLKKEKYINNQDTNLNFNTDVNNAAKFLVDNEEENLSQFHCRTLNNVKNLNDNCINKQKKNNSKESSNLGNEKRKISNAFSKGGNTVEIKKCVSEGFNSLSSNKGAKKSKNSNYTQNILGINSKQHHSKKNQEKYNYQDEEYLEYDDNYYNNGNYSKLNYYGKNNNFNGNKRNKYDNSYFDSSNKFNSSDNSYLTNKQINNRTIYSRSNFEGNEFNQFNQNFGFGSSMYGMMPMFGMGSPQGSIPVINSNYSKETSVYNNYYIINSNVNINNIVSNSPKNETEDINKNSSNYSNFNSSLFYQGNKQFEANEEKSTTNILQKIQGDIYPFIFHYRVHNDILEYSNLITERISYLKDIKLYLIKFIECTINNALGCEVIIDLYGSFATDLSIESSDIDITIKFNEEKTETEKDEIIQKLCSYFKNLNIFETINPILTASVPVIKIVIDPLKVLNEDSDEMNSYKNLRNTEIFQNYKFDKEELFKVKVDLTFIEFTNNSNRCKSTKFSLEWAKSTLSSYPEIKPIIHVLKRYMQIKKLNSSFNGGLSSFSLFLLIAAYLKCPKNKTRINLGRILMELLELYGKYFQYAHSIIDVNLVSPFVLSNEILDHFPVIIDPVTGLNVAKNSYRIEEVRDSFSIAYDFLNKLKILFDKKDLPDTTNVVLDLMFMK